MAFEHEQTRSTNVEDQVQANWLKIKGAVKKEWADLTDDELLKINGSKDKLVGTIMSKYNCTKQEAQSKVDKIWVD